MDFQIKSDIKYFEKKFFYDLREHKIILAIYAIVLIFFTLRAILELVVNIFLCRPFYWDIAFKYCLEIAISLFLLSIAYSVFFSNRLPKLYIQILFNLQRFGKRSSDFSTISYHIDDDSYTTSYGGKLNRYTFDGIGHWYITNDVIYTRSFMYLERNEIGDINFYTLKNLLESKVSHEYLLTKLP